MSVTTWGAGDYPLMAEQLDRAAAAAVDLADVQRGDRVIDVATGTGNAALLAAARGAEVLGVDFEPGLLDVARRRGVDLGLHVRWEAADLAALPVPDEWATVVVSVFGVMYATDHEAAAREMARGTAPNGRVVLASWVPGSFMPAMGQALGNVPSAAATELGPAEPMGRRGGVGGDARHRRAQRALVVRRTAADDVRRLHLRRRLPRTHRRARDRRTRPAARVRDVGMNCSQSCGSSSTPAPCTGTVSCASTANTY